MKILWVNSSYLHPTNRGGQIRTLETLRELHKRHEIHYTALAYPHEPEGPARASEYSTRNFPVMFEIVHKRSLKFLPQLVLGGLFSSLPLAISRWRSEELRRTVAKLMQEERYDAVVCDFLVTAVNFPELELERAVLFQHNVESIIWKRHAETAPDPLRRAFFQLQERRMLRFEEASCQRAASVIAVSDNDVQTMRELFGVESTAVPTGVNLEYFRPPEQESERKGLVFVGSMDWLPNVDGVQWFVKEILPRIRAAIPELPVKIVGRRPAPAIQALAEADPYLEVTGTVPEVRPYLWNAAASIVPLRVGGGTRLKIYESMAAGTPVVSTAIGAEGLDVVDGETIAIADDPEAFARRCLELVDDRGMREKMSRAAMQMVADRYSWTKVAELFEKLLVPGAPESQPR